MNTENVLQKRQSVQGFKNHNEDAVERMRAPIERRK